MGNLALHSAEEPDELRSTTGTVEVPTIRDNDAALVQGARPIIQHQLAARHRCMAQSSGISGKFGQTTSSVDDVSLWAVPWLLLK